MNTNLIPTPEAADAQRAAYMADKKIVDALLAAEPLDVEALRPFAAIYYDSWCKSTKFGSCCGCCYCEVRRRLNKEQPR